MNLRDALLNSLANLPGTRQFHIHVLVSSPRKHGTLFPFAQPRPRSYLQDILILLSEQSTPDAPCILVTGIEACVYNIPATSSAILYVSKVDSTGQATSASPTACLVRSLLTFYADPNTRPVVANHLWIHLFARAQGQYLFPNSSEYSGKRPLSDVKLCSWWKRLLTEVATDLDSRADSKLMIRLHYVLPGYSEVEAIHSLKAGPSSGSWTYGHPYSQSDIPLPCPSDPLAKTGSNLGHFIPSFDDDPKSRFMDELAYTVEADGIKSPERKRPRRGTASDKSSGSKDGEPSEEKEIESGRGDRPLGELGKVTVDEFWERMSFRQECISGAVTGFFTMGVSSSAPSRLPGSVPSPLAPLPGHVSSQMNKRIMTSLLTGVEFSTVERSIRATEALEGAIKGLCEGLTNVPVVHAPRPVYSKHDDHRRTPDREPKKGVAYLAPPRTPSPRMVHGKRAIADISPNPFPEPETSLETYNTYIYGTVSVSNPAPAKEMSNVTSKDEVPHVTVLATRKKKKRT